MKDERAAAAAAAVRLAVAVSGVDVSKILVAVGRPVERRVRLMGPAAAAASVGRRP